MPLIASAYIVFAGGLILGYAGFGFVWTVTIACMTGGPFLLLHSARSKTRLALAGLFCSALILARFEPRAVDLSRREGEGEGSSLLSTARERAGRAIEATFREDAPLAKALLIADRQEIPLEMNDAFIGAGLVHILSISGLHVGIIAASVALLLESVRLSRRVSAGATLIVIAVYVAVLGGQPPALRAAAMVGAVTAGKFSQRPTSPWALLAIGAFIPLVQPRIVSNLGYQLSVAGMAALIAGGVFARRTLAPNLRGWKLKAARELSVSVIATLVSAPLIAWTFGRLSLIGPLSNIAATPIVALLQPLLFLALILSPIPVAAHFAADAAHPLLLALNGCAQLFASLPGAVVEVSPSWLTVLFALGAVGALLVAITSRFPARPALVGAACCACTGPGRAASQDRHHGGRATVTAGAHDGAARIRITAEELDDLVSDQSTFMGLWTSGRLDQPAGHVGHLLHWWLVLRSALDGQPIYTPGSISFRDRDGKPLDLGRSFRPDGHRDEMQHFLEEAGFLHIEGLFTADEMAQVSADMDAAAPTYTPDDKRSWWARTRDGSHRVVRMQGFDRLSPTTCALLDDTRYLDLGTIPGDGHEFGVKRATLDADVAYPMQYVRGYKSNWLRAMRGTGERRASS